MPEYRFYVLEDGHVRRPPELVDCDNDSDAAKKARARSNGPDIEIWQGRRWVMLVKGS